MTHSICAQLLLPPLFFESLHPRRQPIYYRAPTVALVLPFELDRSWRERP
jgi:hypothetical protein